MKHYFIVSFILGALIYQIRCDSNLITRKQFREVRKQCVDEVGLGRVIQNNSTRINNSAEVVHTRKCVRACVAKKFGLINSEGKFDKEKFLEKLIPKKDMLFYEKVSEAITICTDQRKWNDICETHYLVMECMKGFRPFPRMRMNDI
ncbi:GSCOCT00005421001.3-RA-CDS [Cotesia congregata]|uniref:Odorant binding protein 31.5421 n=1 Tax=Cotesia congregata TaxID=51543 RepID=A0A8J2MJG2_COTCN|nr:GSCOCT00005421001.3-RA-CDS [Cotesia congregata]CAG5078136.1 Odorant binding protein 31.5421 [Cotesia congregata]